MPSAKAVSVDIAVPHPPADGWPAFTARKIATGTTIPPRPATSGIANRRRSRSSPMSNSRRASSPITRKKKVIKPLFTQPCRSWDMPKLPSRSEISVCHSVLYELASRLVQTSAPIVAASRTAALPVSVRRNCRSGVCRCRPHAVWSAVAATCSGCVIVPGRLPCAQSITQVRLDTGAAVPQKLVVCSQLPALSTGSEERVPELSRSRRLLVLAVCCSSLFIVGLDVTVLNIALPSIQHDLHAPVSGLQWTIDAYTLVVAGSTGDRVGRRRTFQVGLATFTAGSLLCSLAPGLGWLVAFRAVQAIGGSMLNPVALSIIANAFTDDRERARALGVWGAVFGLSMALGPVLGGVLVATVGWRGIFWVNIPVGIAAIVLTALVVPESRAARPRRVDPAGQILIIAMLASLTYAIIEGPHLGWGSAAIAGLFALAALAAAALGIYEPPRDEPLLDLRFFRSAPFTGAVLIAISAFSALAGFLFLNTLYLQDVRQLSALHAGLYTLPMAAMTVLLAPLSGRITGQRGPRLPLLVAGVMMTAGALLMWGVTATTPVAWLLVAYLAFGIGNGLVNPPISNTAVSGMPRAQAGVAAAVASTSRQIGGSLGVALTGSAVASALNGPLRSGFVPASRAGWLITAGCGVLVLVAGLVTSGRWARATAARTAALLMSDEAKVPVTAGAGVVRGDHDH